MTDSFIRKGELFVVNVAKSGKYKGKFRKKKVYEKYKKVSDSMLKHHQVSMSAGEPAESQCDPNDPSDPVASASDGIQNSKGTEHSRNDDSDATHDAITGRRVIELAHLAKVGKKIIVHLW